VTTALRTDPISTAAACLPLRWEQAAAASLRVDACRHDAARYLHHHPARLADAHIDDALQVLVELITNAATHGKGMTGATLDVDVAGCITIEVCDASPAAPLLQLIDPADAADPNSTIGTHGQGLRIVTELAQWDHISLGDAGKRVRATCHPPQPATQPR
jgi:hypothetical protein